MPADKGFMERIRRIESGKQWQPDGVILEDRALAARRRRRGGVGVGLISFVMSASLVAGAGWAVAQKNPDFVAGLLGTEMVAPLPEVGAAPATEETPDA